MPHINYCFLLWGHANKRIFKLQKKAVRIIYKERRLSYTDPIFKDLNLLKINDIYRLQLLKLYFICKQTFFVSTLIHFIWHLTIEFINITHEI